MDQKTLPKVALGAWAWGTGAAGGDQVFGNALDEKELKPVFDAAMDEGLSLWDTAAVYGMGSSESILGAFIADTPRESLIISTKFTPQIADGTPEAMENMLEASMGRLNTDYIDIYWIHNPADVEKWTPYLAPLVKSGKVGRVGVSNHNLAEIERAQAILNEQGVSLSAVQNHYSLLCRSSERAGIIDYCREHNMDFFSYMVLEQGALSGAYGANKLFPEGSDRANSYNQAMPQIETVLEVMRSVADAHDATVAQIAVAWAIAKNTLPIVGVTKPKHVADAAKAARIELTADEIAALEDAALAVEVNTVREWEKPMD